jgi:pimeloyl-ACP methyl ester carboxylesterase
MSLPYHDARRPDHMERAEGLVAANIGQTLATNRQAIMEVRLAADWLEGRGYSRLGVLGTSIGSCIGFLAMAHDPRLKYNAFIHVSSMFADVVWRGLSTSHVRQTLESRLGLEELRRLWAPISPTPFIPRLRGSRNPMLVIAGKYDLTFPYELSLQTMGELQDHDIGFERMILPCGHYTMAMFPFREIVGFSVVRFFRRHRD